MKRVLFCFLAGIIIYLMFFSKESRGIVIRQGFKEEYNQAIENSLPGKQYLFIIAIENYQYWPSIRGPVKEALQLKKVIVSKYHFDEVKELYNEKATKEAIRNYLISFQAGRENQLKENDSLLIYFSGHGQSYTEESWNGYWIPYNGDIDSNSRAYWFSNSELTGLINKIKSNHILIVSDSCYASTLIANEYDPNDSETILNTFPEIYNRCSRKVLASGGFEKVPEKSEFARLFNLELEKNKKPWIEIKEIYVAIRLKLMETMGYFPEYGYLNNSSCNSQASFILFTREGWNILFNTKDSR